MHCGNKLSINLEGIKKIYLYHLLFIFNHTIIAIHVLIGAVHKYAIISIFKHINSSGYGDSKLGKISCFIFDLSFSLYIDFFKSSNITIMGETLTFTL